MAFLFYCHIKTAGKKNIWNVNGNFTALSRQIFVDQSDHNAVNSSSISINNACKQGKDIFSNGMFDFYLLGLANDSYLKITMWGLKIYYFRSEKWRTITHCLIFWTHTIWPYEHKMISKIAVVRSCTTLSITRHKTTQHLYFFNHSNKGIW